MKQKQPKFSGILVVAVLTVLVLFIVSLSPLLAASGSKDTTYSEIYYYFENQQVTSFRLDLGTAAWSCGSRRARLLCRSPTPQPACPPAVC